jgi:hypothetical protein
MLTLKSSGERMTKLRTEDYIFYQGDKFKIEFYYTPKNDIPAKAYYEASSHQVQIKLLALVKYMAEHGKIFDKTKFREVDKKYKIYEFKPKAERFFNFFSKGKKIIITNAYPKKGQKVDRQELDKAINIKKDYDVRVKGGNYYA